MDETPAAGTAPETRPAAGSEADPSVQPEPAAADSPRAAQSPLPGPRVDDAENWRGVGRRRDCAEPARRPPLATVSCSGGGGGWAPRDRRPAPGRGTPRSSRPGPDREAPAYASRPWKKGTAPASHPLGILHVSRAPGERPGTSLAPWPLRPPSREGALASPARVGGDVPTSTPRGRVRELP